MHKKDEPKLNDEESRLRFCNLLLTEAICEILAERNIPREELIRRVRRRLEQLSVNSTWQN